MAESLLIETTRPEDRDCLENTELRAALASLECEPVSLHYSQLPEQPDRLRAAARIIIGGVPFDYSAEAPRHVQVYLTPWLVDTAVPTLGICNGHQAIGLVFGAELLCRQEVETGLCVAAVIDDQTDDPLLANLGPYFEIYSNHWASLNIEAASTVTRLAQSLPKPATSTGCRNQIIKVMDRPIYGTQFHPEKSNAGRLLLRNFLVLSEQSFLHDNYQVNRYNPA